jgi:hypothetical protein
MASHSFKQGIFHAQPGTYSPVKCFLKFTAADISAGVATINKGSELVASVDGTAATGIIVITMHQPYKGLLGFNATMVNSDGLYYEPELAAESLADSTPTVTVHTRTVAGPADLADIPDGAVVFIELTLEN